MWVPPGCVELTPQQEEDLTATLRRLCGPRAEPVHYLSLLATADRHRGRGLGMGLLRADLAALDRAGAPAYLESTNPANLRRYEGAGFRHYGSFALPGGGPLVTQMWREPGAR